MTKQFTFDSSLVAIAQQAIAAGLGKGSCLEYCKTAARGGAATLKAFEMTVAHEICQRFDLKPASLATLQAMKRDAAFIDAGNPAGKDGKAVNPATTVYTYCLALRPVAGNHDGIEAVTTSNATGSKTPKAKAEKGNKPEAAPIDNVQLIASALAVLIDAHKARILKVEDYAALQALVPASQPSNVVDMGNVVEMPLQLQAA